MNPFVYWISIFYHWYYDKPNRRKSAYENAVMISVFFIYMNIISILVILNLWDSFSFGFEKLSKIGNYIQFGVCFGSGYFIFYFLAPKKKIMAINYETLNRFKDRTIALTYWIVSLLLLFVVAFYLRREQLGMN